MEDGETKPKRLTRIKDESIPSTSNKVMAEDSDEEAPLITKKSNMKRKTVVIRFPVPSTSEQNATAIKNESDEHEPLVKKVNTSKLEDESDEDIPLAARRKATTTTTTTPQTSPRKSPSVRHSSRPPRPNRRFNETESEVEARPRYDFT